MGPTLSPMAAFEVRRSTVIPGSADRLFPLVNNFHEWARWSPWEGADPGMDRRYFGPDSGVGAGYAWSGNRKAGSGTMEIVESVAPDVVRVRLEFTRPFKALNSTSLTFSAVAGGTEVTWLMTGESKGVAKIFSLVVPMDKLVGPDFEKGLASLATVAGHPA